MKKLLIGAVALSLLGASAASAAPYRGYDNDRGNNARYQQDHRYDKRAPARRAHWRQGQRLPPGYYSRGQYVDYRTHRLRAPPRGYRWVKADNDYALIAISTGLIAAIIAANN